ncbi:MAG: hypothetical protein AAFV53_39545 [Myxococcota bacterium]
MSLPVILVAGFGPFFDVVDNPAAAVARGVDGATIAGVRVIGRVMPVSYIRAPRMTFDWIDALNPIGVVGVGVASKRTWITVETVGQNVADPLLADVDGQKRSQLEEDGPAIRRMTAPPGVLAAALGGVVGEDAGRYVCNAWTYSVGVVQDPNQWTSFIHIPPRGLAPHVLLSALSAVIHGGRDLA